MEARPDYCRDGRDPEAQPCTRPEDLLETQAAGKSATPTDNFSNREQRPCAATRRFRTAVWPLAGAANGSGVACLELIAQRIVITAFKTAFLPLALPRFHQVLQAPRALRRWFATFRAPLVPLHPQLVLALPRDSQMRELIDYAVSHVASNPLLVWSRHSPRNGVPNRADI